MTLNVLVVNCGSSSLKYQLIDMDRETVLARGTLERIGLPRATHSYRRSNRPKSVSDHCAANHREAVELMFRALVADDTGVIHNVADIDAVGHRIVHGGEQYSQSVLIDDTVLDALRRCIPLAPVHNPANISGIEAVQSVMRNRNLPHLPMVAVFDTAFHQTLPPRAYIYPIPYKYYERNRIRRYGFHGTSLRYVTERAAQMLGRPVDELNLISCHLGNGASVTAIRGGKSIDTSMGFTPLEGVMMGTRSGSLDPAIVCYLAAKLDHSVASVERLLNEKSGMLGISGISSDLRDVHDAQAGGNERAELALDVFSYRIRKYIGEYAVALGRLDAIIFTAGVGEHDALIRQWSCKGLKIIGAELDKKKNRAVDGEAIINRKDSNVKILVIPTNEELMIARDTRALISQRRREPG